MKRREFIKASALASTGLAIVGCKDSVNPDTQPAYAGKVAVIGAGISGLYAGYLLKQKNVNVTIFEASDRIGGRIRSLKSFSDFDIELGADEIRGKRSTWYDFVKSTSATFISEPATDYYQIGGVLRSSDLWTADPDFTAAKKLIEGASSYTGTDVSLQTYMDNNRLANRVQHIVNAEVANKRGTSASRLGMKGVTEEAQVWSAGTESFMLANRSLHAVLEEKFKDTLSSVSLNTVITRIDYTSQGDQGVIIEDSKGQKQTFDKVIITVPLSILKANDLKFTPELPKTKTDAMARMGMDAGVKIIMEFTKPFWAPGTSLIYGQNTVPLFAVTSLGRSKAANILTAYACGSRGETLARLGTTAVNTILTELDSMYGKGNASSTLKNAYTMDWAKEQYIKGTVSYPLTGGGLNNRQELSRSVLKKLYFAGEATHYGGHSGTVHGAMETGQRVVNELLQEAA